MLLYMHDWCQCQIWFIMCACVRACVFRWNQAILYWSAQYKLCKLYHKSHYIYFLNVLSSPVVVHTRLHKLILREWCLTNITQSPVQSDTLLWPPPYCSNITSQAAVWERQITPIHSKYSKIVLLLRYSGQPVTVVTLKAKFHCTCNGLDI